MKFYINYSLYYLANKFSKIFCLIEDFENFLIKKKVNNIIEKPIYVCGCPRSGTTIITHLLSKSSILGFFQYRDVPFLNILYSWSFINNIFYYGLRSSPRPHKDKIEINANSPDSFEEFFWSKNIEDYEKNFSKKIDQNTDNKTVVEKYKFLISKVLYTRKKKRYISKGNYNIFRLKFLKKIFTDAKIIICIRNPIDTVKSMVKVHKIFCEEGKKDKFFDNKLHFLCHFEFGNKRKAFKINKENFDRTNHLWTQKKDFEGYLLQWIDLHEYLMNEVFSDEELKKNIFLIDNSSIYKHSSSLSKLFDFCELQNNDDKQQELNDEKQIFEHRLDDSLELKKAFDIYEKLKKLKIN